MRSPKYWGWNGGYTDFTKNLKKGAPGTRPNKTIVWVCWILVAIALLIAFLKIVLKVF